MSDFARLKSLPPYVFTYLAPLKDKLHEEGRQVIDLAMGNPDLPPPEHALIQLKKYVDELHRHRYGAQNGIERLREAILHWYQRRYDVSFDIERETAVTIGSKTGLAYLAFAIFSIGDRILVPDPGYPIHHFGPRIADAKLCSYSTLVDDIWGELEKRVKEVKPKAVIVNFPSNPTTRMVGPEFFEKLVALAKKKHFYIIHDFAYADIYFDEAPQSILSIPGASDVACESFSLSKSYSLAGWRMGHISGCEKMVGALKRIKCYLDYGSFMPLELAAADILDDENDYPVWARGVYQERSRLIVNRLRGLGWEVTEPAGTMFVWAKIPNFLPESSNSIDFCKKLLLDTGLVLSPGVGFGDYGEGYVRVSLILDCDALLEAMVILERWQAEVGAND